MPVTTPEGETVAISVLDETQLPPAEGVSVVVVPTHMVLGPVILMAGFPLIIICSLGSEEQPRFVVNINLAVPFPKPVTIPPFVTEAIEGLMLIQLPPVTGVSAVVAPWHISVAPVTTGVGLGDTVWAM